MVRLFFLLVLHCATAQPAQAQHTFELQFEVRYGLFHIADIAMQARETPQAYAVTGQVVSAGLVHLLRDFHFDLSVVGLRDGDTPRPRHYVGDADTGHRRVEVEMRYPNDVPTLVRIAPAEPPGPWVIEPAEQVGTVDLMTALYRIVRPRGVETLCDWSVELFDGRRRSRLLLDAPHHEDGRVICTGAYQRIAGYPPDDLQDYRSLPFQLTFAPFDGRNWQLARIVTQTPYGRMRIIR